MEVDRRPRRRGRRPSTRSSRRRAVPMPISGCRPCPPSAGSAPTRRRPCPRSRWTSATWTSRSSRRRPRNCTLTASADRAVPVLIQALSAHRDRAAHRGGRHVGYFGRDAEPRSARSAALLREEDEKVGHRGREGPRRDRPRGRPHARRPARRRTGGGPAPLADRAGTDGPARQPPRRRAWPAVSRTAHPP